MQKILLQFKQNFFSVIWIVVLLLQASIDSFAQCTEPTSIVSQTDPNTMVCLGASMNLRAMPRSTAANQPTAGSAQWYKDGQPIAGANTAFINVANVTAATVGTYVCRLGGRAFFGCANQFVESTPIVVTLGNVGVSSESPADQTMCAGSEIPLFVTPTGNPLRYRWRYNLNTIADALTSTYTPRNSGEYKVDVVGGCGTVTKTFNVTISPRPSVSVQPTDATKCEGQLHLFQALINNAGSFKWQKDNIDLNDGGNISGSGTNALRINNISSSDIGSYKLNYTGTGGCASTSLSTNAASLAVQSLSIDSFTPAQSKCEGENVTFSVTTSGTVNSYQWKKGGNILTGENGSSLTLNNVSSADAATYSVDVSGPCGTLTQSGMTLTVAPKSVILTSPQSATKCEGESITFTGSASGVGTYQWTKDGSDLTDGGNISGSNTGSLTITNLCATCDAGTYVLKAFGTGGCSTSSSNSTSATLTINSPIVVTSHTASTTKCESENITLEVAATGTITGYQWKKAGNIISGQVSSSMTLSNLTTADAAEYSVDIFGPCGTVSQGGINLGINLKPVIVNHPTSLAKCVGETATFSGSANNAGSYVWVKGTTDLSDGGNVSGSASTSLSLSNVCVACDAGSYALKVFGPGACSAVSVTSNAAILTVNTPISINSHTVSTTKCEGENITLEVAAAGTITGYQWKKAGNVISGQVSSSMTLSNLTTADAAEYSVDIFGPCGTVSQGGINLGVNLKPVIVNHPTSLAKCVGETATFSGSANNAGSYVWVKSTTDLSDGGNVSGSASTSLSLSNVCVACDAGSYALKVFGPGACSAVSVTSNAAILTVNTPISINSHTVSTTKCESENITLEVAAAGTITGYQWKKAGNVISGQVSSSMTLSNLTTADAAEYSVDIFGPCGTVSQGGINLGINLKPVIVNHPTSLAKCVGETATFSGSANNAGSYVWVKGTTDLSDGGNVSGSASTSLSLSNVCVACDAASYALKVFGSGACSAVSVTSNAAILTVNTPISINSHTVSTTKCEDENITLEVAAAGTITGYQWKKAGNVISGQVSSSMTLSNLTTADAAEYSVDIFGPCGTVSQGGINLGINLKPVIVNHPTSLAKCVGETATFSGSANNAGSYVWVKGTTDLSDGGNVSGSASTSLSLSNVCVACDAGSYALKVFGPGACSAVSVTSNAAILTVNTPISINSHTVSTTKCEGESITLEVAAAGTITGYQWKKAGNVISGQVSSSMTLSNLTTADAAEYSVDIFGPCGTVSQGGINLGVNLKPSFSLEPKSVSKCVTEMVKFETAASDYTQLYWQKNGVDLIEGGNISGTKTNTLTIENICSTCDQGIYQLVATGTGVCSSYITKSATAELIINELITKVNLPTFPEVCEGANTSIEVSFEGIALGYQWYKNGFKLNNNVQKRLNLLNLTELDNGNYSVEIFGPCGSVISKASTLKITSMPKISKATNSLKACIGESVALEVSGSNFGVVSWFKDGSDLKISNPTLNISPTSEASSGQYIAYVAGVGVCSNKNISSNFIQLEVASKITIEKLSKNVSCFGSSDGNIQIKPNGGFGSPYTVSWQNPGSLKGELVNNLPAGLYEFTVADSRGCSQKDSMRISQPEKLLASLISKTLNYCESSGKASLKTTASGGIKPYKVSWNDSPNFIEFERQNLKAGTYTLKVLDANNCESVLATSIEDSTSNMSAKLTYNQPSCFGKPDAKLTVLATSGRGGYKYTWTGVNYTGTTFEITNLAVNNENAQAIVTDALGCEVKSDIIKLISPAALTLNLTKQREVCPSKPFEVNVTVADGTKYEWTTPLGKKLLGAIVVGDTIGSYKIAVTNSLGCVAIDSISVIPNSNVKPFFASPTQAPVNKEVVFVDLTSPLASNVKWIYPNTAKMISEDLVRLKLSFAATGTYKISSQVTVSDCIYTFSKNINIVDKVDDGEFKPPFGYDNLDFTMLSNPVTNGMIGIKLNEDHPKNFNISLHSIIGTQNVFIKEYQNYNEDTLFIEVPANLNMNTSYILTIENEVSKKAKRVIILN